MIALGDDDRADKEHAFKTLRHVVNETPGEIASIGLAGDEEPSVRDNLFTELLYDVEHLI